MNELDREEEPTAQLVRVTFAYSLDEDRVRMDALDSDGGTIRLWFTARLLGRLASHMVQRRPEPQGLSTDYDLTQDDPLGSPDEQQRVVCHAESTSVLITAIDIQLQPQQIVMIFKDINCGNRLAFALSLSNIEQWNVVLKHCFKKAGWSLEPFKNSLPRSKNLQAAITLH